MTGTIAKVQKGCADDTTYGLRSKNITCTQNGKNPVPATLDLPPSAELNCCDMDYCNDGGANPGGPGGPSGPGGSGPDGPGGPGGPDGSGPGGPRGSGPGGPAGKGPDGSGDRALVSFALVSVAVAMLFA
ncbi:hypothetical protein AAVH_19303 [Aphelenchoides avenae]|nr:hypothetical protein AAVH_19303 [Aphelenchus avenae]